MQTSRVLTLTGAPATTVAVRWPALGVLMLGLAVLYGVGFASLPQVHNATHDTRHANGFPCH
jgi:cobalt transporter subunit CbtB